MKFFTEWERLKVEKKLLLIMMTMLSFVIILLLFALLSAYKNQKVIVLPPKVDKEFWVAGNTLSSSYLEQVAFYLSDRLLTVSPATVRASFDTIIGFAEPSMIKLLRTSLSEQADTIIREKIFQVFYPAAFASDTQKRTITVKGTIKRFSGNVYQSEAESVIIFEYTVLEGRLYITSIETK
ncbi:MAG: type IV conjugative transfer system protein TraE [Deferribacteraceae bacterium]|jgi:conjugal transfer pilus assembly protein TraE|nr:type IV conjugative transfer system protein TraE [Deferribacteraceae bacterium]